MCWRPSRRDLLSSYWKQSQQSEDRLAMTAKANVGQRWRARISNGGESLETPHFCKHPCFGPAGCLDPLDGASKQEAVAAAGVVDLR